jgi:flagellar secretion chaperone FliS
MLMSNHFGAKAYAAVGVETSVSSASPYELVLMLFDTALSSIAQAKLAITAGDTVTKGKCISKAVRIIEEGLKAGLDDRAGQLTHQLRSLYDYMNKRLLVASLRNSPESLDEVTRLLSDIRTAWAEIDPAKRQLVPTGTVYN